MPSPDSSAMLTETPDAERATVRHAPERTGYRGKRAIDVLLVIATAPFWVPLTAVVALLVRWRLGSPVLFVQERPGLHGRLFRLIKFRSMRDARDASGALLPDADRLTSFGRWLRATSLDELPELWNVLRGEMSLIGPRPLLIQYLGRYSPRHARRHEVRPGLTGLSQVSGRNALDWPSKLDLDVEYVERCSPGLDLWILWRTAVAVVRREGISAPGTATTTEFMGYDPDSVRVM